MGGFSWRIKGNKSASGITEADVTTQIRNTLRVLGIPHIKHFGTLGSQRGVTDLIGTIPPAGRALWLEVKRPGSEPNQEQSDFIETHVRAGGLAFYASTVEEVIGRLADAGYAPAMKMKVAWGGK